MITVGSIVGARPQFVKAAVVSRALAAQGIREVLIHTGQHYDDNMSRIFFDELEIARPDHNLGIGSGPHGMQTGLMLKAIEIVLQEQRPDCVLVYGDTNSTLAGALAAAKLHIAVAHVEAGLRSFNRAMPEEINRVLTDHVASLLFAPTATAVRNLEREGIAGNAVHNVGDVMFDAALHYGRLAESRSRILAELKLTPRGYVLVTVHRAENTDDPARFRAIRAALDEIARERPVIFPMHPRTRALLETEGIDASTGGVRLIDPVGYLDMLTLEKNAALIATDSGGVQKEAFFYRVPAVTLRNETEWVELVELGWNRLAPPTDALQVVAIMREALASGGGTDALPYGSGNASRLIATQLANFPQSHAG